MLKLPADRSLNGCTLNVLLVAVEETSIALNNAASVPVKENEAILSLCGSLTVIVPTVDPEVAAVVSAKNPDCQIVGAKFSATDTVKEALTTLSYESLPVTSKL